MPASAIEPLAAAAWKIHSLVDARTRWNGIARCEIGRDVLGLAPFNATHVSSGSLRESLIDQRIYYGRLSRGSEAWPDLQGVAATLASKIRQLQAEVPGRPVIVSPFHYVSQYANIYVIDELREVLGLESISVVSGVPRDMYGDDQTLIPSVTVLYTYGDGDRNGLGLRVARTLRRNGVAVLFADVPPFTLHRYPMETVGVSIFGRNARIHNGVFRLGAPFEQCCCRSICVSSAAASAANCSSRCRSPIPTLRNGSPRVSKQRWSTTIATGSSQDIRRCTRSRRPARRLSAWQSSRAARTPASGGQTQCRLPTGGNDAMEPINLPQFRDVSWRWIAYATSTLVAVAIVFAFVHDVELKQDVRAEIVSPAEIKIQGLSGLVSDIYVSRASRVAQGEPLFRLDRDFSLASNGLQRKAFDEHDRDEQIRTSDAQYLQRKADLSAQRDAARLAAQSRRAEIAALDEQLAQNRALSGEASRKLARLESVADYITADRIEQASADTHQAKVAVAQSAARRQPPWS